MSTQHHGMDYSHLLACTSHKEDSCTSSDSGLSADCHLSNSSTSPNMNDQTFSFNEKNTQQWTNCDTTDYSWTQSMQGMLPQETDSYIQMMNAPQDINTQQHDYQERYPSPELYTASQNLCSMPANNVYDLLPALSKASSSATSEILTKPKRKRVITGTQRTAANKRERRRMYSLNNAFDSLRERIPTFSYEKKLSRIETLKLAMTYISFMSDLVEGGDPKHVSLHPGSKHASGFRRKATRMIS